MKIPDRDELLAKLGLERKASTGEWLVGALGFFGVGLLVGAGLGLLLAPKSGRELREGIRHRVRRERLGPDDGAALDVKGHGAV
jgi:YtxH-like protein